MTIDGKMTKYNFRGFFLKDTEVYELENLETHIHFLIKNHNLFGLNMDFIKKVYEKYREPLYFEGKARRELLMLVFRRGFIWIREGREGYLFEMDKKYKDLRRLKSIVNFLKQGIEKKYFDYDTKIQINTIANSTVYCVKDLIAEEYNI